MGWKCTNGSIDWWESENLHAKFFDEQLTMERMFMYVQHLFLSSVKYLEII